MSSPITLEQLKNASLDAEILARFVNGSEVEDNQLRKLPFNIGTLRKLIQQLSAQMHINAAMYDTKARMMTSRPADGSFAFVHNDRNINNNGLYQRVASEWVQQQFNPAPHVKAYINDEIGKVNQAINDEIGKINALTVNKNSLYPFIYRPRGESQVVSKPQNKLQSNLLRIQINNAKKGYLYYLRNFYHAPNDATDGGVNNGWGFVAVTKDSYGTADEQLQYITSVHTSKYRIVPNTGIARFTISATDGSDVSIDVVIDTDGMDTSFNYLQLSSASSLWGCIIDESCYQYQDRTLTEAEVQSMIDVTLSKKAESQNNDVMPVLPPTQALAVIPVLSDGSVQPVLEQHNLHTSIPPASTTKTLTALIAIESGLPLTTSLTVTASDIKTGSGNNLKIGDIITLEDALYNMMLPSSNTSAQLVARYAGEYMGIDFVSYMNEKARLLGMTNSKFVNPTGLAQSGQRSTAHDLAMLSIAAAKSDVLQLIWSARTRTVNLTGLEPRKIEIISSLDYLQAYDWYLGGKSGTLTPAYYHMLSWVKLPNGHRAAVFVASQSANQRLTDTIAVQDYITKMYAYPMPHAIVRK